MRDLFFKLISTQMDISFRNLGIEHTLQVVTFATLLSKKRNIDQTKAITAAYFHDIAYYTTHYHENHAARSATMMEPYLHDEDVLHAIKHHSEKDVISSHPLSELLKDADVLSHQLNGILDDIETKRYHALIKKRP